MHPIYETSVNPKPHIATTLPVQYAVITQSCYFLCLNATCEVHTGATNVHVCMTSVCKIRSVYQDSTVPNINIVNSIVKELSGTGLLQEETEHKYNRRVLP
jgi:hypothetical protein